MSNMINNNGSLSKGSRQNKRPAPLKMVKPEEVRQYRPPVIIHTYSPKIHHVDPAQFSAIVQSLTGRGQKRKPEASPRPLLEPKSDDFSCASPSSSADSGGIAGILGGPDGMISPRGPLASFEHRYQTGGFDVSCASPHTASGKASSMFSNAVLAAAKASAASAGPQYSPLFSGSFPGSFPHLFSPLPSPNLLSPNFIADLPAISPSSYQAFDAFGSNPFVPSPSYGRFGGAGVLPSPGSSNAFKDMALMLSRD